MEGKQTPDRPVVDRLCSTTYEYDYEATCTCVVKNRSISLWDGTFDSSRGSIESTEVESCAIFRLVVFLREMKTAWSDQWNLLW